MATTITQVRFPRYGMSTQPDKTGQAALDADMDSLRIVSSTAYNDTFTGGENRNWKVQIRNGTNATTQASGVRTERTGLPVRAFAKGYVNGNQAIGNARSSSKFAELDVAGISGASASQILAVRNAARSKFSRSVERALTQFSGGVFLAELRETLHMIRRPGQALRKAVGQYLGDVHKNGRRLKRRPRRDREAWLSNTWLEYSFGWLPLLNDLDDAASYLQRRQDALIRELVPVRGLSSSRFLIDEEATAKSSAATRLSTRVRTISEVTNVLAGAVSSQALGPGLINASAMGLGPRSFAPTLWEVIPWSFLVDYFTNVGDVITGWSNQQTQLSWGRDTLVEDKYQQFFDISQTTSYTSVLENTVIPGNQKFSVKSFTRTPITTPPVPGFLFEIPGMGVKWLNMGALAASRREISSLRLFS